MQYLACLHGCGFPLALATLRHWGSPLGWSCEQPSKDCHLAASFQRHAIAGQVKGTTTHQCHPTSFSSGSSNSQTSSSQQQLQHPLMSPSGCDTLAEKEEDFSFLVDLFLNAISKLSDRAHPTAGEEQEMSTHSVISQKGQGLYGEYLKQAKRPWLEAWATKGKKESIWIPSECHPPPSFRAESCLSSGLHVMISHSTICIPYPSGAG